ncbi:MAG: DUF2089 domain-containing protein [Clostridia bacterium]|jgi:hypothetical protein|nr:DUF2089 domain-containing protein [Clostridia bacterium]MCI9459353.1 DUF2089 domain-containing protein [Clostridia bacterium]
MIKVPTKCPICGKAMYAAEVKCDGCGTVINNKFGFSVFEKLDEKQTAFVLAFVECEGSIKDMEKRLGISYPTVKTRLAEIKKILGLAEGKSYKMNVLDDLGKGEIDVEAAIRLIKNKEAD